MLIKQTDQNDCGVACIAMIAHHYGLKVPLLYIKEYTKTTREGTTIDGLIKAASKIGFEAKAFKGELSDLQDMPLPLILHINKGEFGHFVVLKKLNKKRFTIADPAGEIFKPKIIDYQEFLTGVFIYLEPKEDFKPLNIKESAF